MQLFTSANKGLQPDVDGLTCAEVLELDRGPCLVADSLGEFRHTTDAVLFNERDSEWVLPGERGRSAGSVTLASGDSNFGVEYNGRMSRGCDSVLLPLPTGIEGILEWFDRDAGWLKDGWKVRVAADAVGIVMTDRRPEIRPEG